MANKMCVNDCPHQVAHRYSGGLCYVCRHNRAIAHSHDKENDKRPRCRVCEVLLDRVKHTGDVCHYKRCQQEAALGYDYRNHTPGSVAH